MIDKATAEKIKDVADIVDVVSDYVHLQRRGANYVGLCPFHNERTPSFSVNRSRNFCYCFSCHKGGSPVNFIMEKEGISYHDALLQLAKKYNITVEERELTDEQRRTQSEREAMYVANEWAANCMQEWMQQTDDGRDIGLSYLYGRGITAEAVAKFRLGYSLDNGQALESASRRAGFEPELFQKLGLLGRSQEGRVYDRFRGRVMFPIMNASGKVVGFGGRDLKGGPAKYINSPESAIYKKSNELYGIFQAKSEMVRQDKCFLVEGYLDVIGMWQAGLQNVVASSGTALTDGQIALIHRFTNKITLIYDGDAAGIKAALRGIDMLLRHRMEVKVLLLPDGHDPHSFANTLSSEEFREYIKAHETDIIRFQTKVLLDEAGQDPQRRIAAANSVVQSIASIPDPLSRAVYIQECAQVFGLPESSIASAAETVRKAQELRHQHDKEAELRRMANSKAPATREMPIEGGQASAGAQSSVGSQYSSGGQSVPIGQPAVAEVSSPHADIKAAGLQAREGKEDLLARECVKYGLAPFCDIEFENGTRGVMNVVEFVVDELAADGIRFQNQFYASIVSTILGLKEEMQRGLQRYMAECEQSYEQFRREQTERIASSAIDMNGIAIAEKKIEEEIASRREDDTRRFMSEYTARALASHEDGRIREYTNAIITSQPKLSNRYTKSMRPEEIRKMFHNYMEDSVVHRILELKNQILDQQINEKMLEMHEAVARGDGETITRLQLEIRKLRRIGMPLAKDLGDRIIRLSGR